MKIEAAALALSGVLVAAGSARGQDLGGASAVRFELAVPAAADLADRGITLGSSPAVDLTRAAALGVDGATPAPAAEFGKADGSWWLTVAPGVATTFGNETTAGVRASLTTFVSENIQVGGELGMWYFQQPGDNAFGGNLEFVLRWHFVNTGSWTVFLDGGIGVLLASGDVPTGGTSFDFVPRIGAGFTYKLTDSGVRLEAGLGWHHLSNARINGDDENPSRDLPMLHVGLVFPL